MDEGHARSHVVRRRLPTEDARVRAQVMWDLWWTKLDCGWFSPCTSVSSANSHCTNCSTLIFHHPGLVR
jgi:hypothetical protein